MAVQTLPEATDALERAADALTSAALRLERSVAQLEAASGVPARPRLVVIEGGDDG